MKKTRKETGNFLKNDLNKKDRMGNVFLIFTEKKNRKNGKKQEISGGVGIWEVGIKGVHSEGNLDFWEGNSNKKGKKKKEKKRGINRRGRIFRVAKNEK